MPIPKEMPTLTSRKIIQQAIELVRNAKFNLARNTNSIMVFTYIQLGSLIVENRQSGNAKAKYGDSTLKLLSDKLTKEFGKGFSVTNLEQMRSFYLLYKSRIPKSQPLAGKSISKNNLNKSDPKPSIKSKSQPVAGKSFVAQFPLSWTHYAILCKIENKNERSFYEIEALAGNWGKRELERQINSGLFERLTLSKDKQKVRQLASKGQVIEKPEDILKSSLVLEFLGLDEKDSYNETDLESAIISKIEIFLLEMGKGFLFQGRQVRFSFDEEDFYVDLVLYNRILKCFVLVDLKIGKLKHQDIGQMQMYVNYYDRYIKHEDENPSIGIIICKNKSDAVIEITLPKGNKQIFASQYKLYLPTKAVLKKLISN